MKQILVQSEGNCGSDIAANPPRTATLQCGRAK